MTLTERPLMCEKCNKTLDGRDKMKGFQIVVCEHCHHVMEYKTSSMRSERKPKNKDILLNVSSMSKEEATTLMRLLEGKL